MAEADLEGADLTGADLTKANLCGARLTKANLYEAELGYANLSGADLAAASLPWANLVGADLRGANLMRADFTGSVLHEADVTDAETSNTNWADVDLSSTKGLLEVLHSGPSTVGTNSLARSKGRIPEAFLKGCGLADWEVEQAKLYDPAVTPEQVTQIQQRVRDLRSAAPIQFYSAFISYSHDDKAFARALHDALQEAGVRCWLDEKQLLPGDDIHEQVDRGIRLWDKVILCASRSSLTSWWVDKEVTSAFAKEARIMKERGKKVLALIPLNLDGFLFDWQNGKAEEVRSRFAPDFTAWQSGGLDFTKAIEPLIGALRVDDGGREPPPMSRL
jgi:hypothetical protein